MRLEREYFFFLLIPGLNCLMGYYPVSDIHFSIKEMPNWHSNGYLGHKFKPECSNLNQNGFHRTGVHQSWKGASCPIPPLVHGPAGAQRGALICLRTHSKPVAEQEPLPDIIFQITINVQALPCVPTPNHSSRNSLSGVGYASFMACQQTQSEGNRREGAG